MFKLRAIFAHKITRDVLAPQFEEGLPLYQAIDTVCELAKHAKDDGLHSDQDRDEDANLNLRIVNDNARYPKNDVNAGQ